MIIKSPLQPHLLPRRAHLLFSLFFPLAESVAKDSDASLGDRASSAFSAVGDKKDETSHNAKVCTSLPLRVEPRY